MSDAQTDRELIIRGCEYWVKNHKDESLPLAYSSVVELLALLKEQEAVKPTWQQGKAYCGSCGKRIPLKIGARFCHKCGRQVSWK